MEKLSITERKNWAKELIIAGELSHKDIAQKAGVAENELTEWIKTGHWETLRKSALVTRRQLLRDLYDTLDAMKDEAKKLATDGDPDTKPDTNGIYKLTLAIRNLEGETSLGEMAETGQRFISFVLTENYPLAKEITHWFDLFIDDYMSKQV